MKNVDEINVLIVEDESIVAMELESYISRLGYHVVGICSSAEETIHTLQTKTVDIVFMDICLKGGTDGIETAKRVKRIAPNTEIIFLTAYLDDYNIDRAIEVNPTAYLSKPFNKQELRAFLKIAVYRMNHHLREGAIQKEAEDEHIVLDNEFSYDPATSTLYCCFEVIHLTNKESALLALLIKNKNSIVDLYTIENVIWPDKASNPNTVRTLVKRLRQKLKHRFITTVASQGYRFVLQR